MIQNVNNWSFPGQSKYVDTKDLKQVRDVLPESREREIRVDSVELSREGMASLRERVQNMRGHTSLEEVMRMKEILPKLQMNPSDGHLWAMRKDMQSSVDALKQSKGSYTFDDLVSTRMNAYAKQYDALQKSYADGSRDVYVSDGIDESGNLKYHKVTQEEDFGYLKKAFDRIADEMGFSAKSQEISRQINEKFGGQKAEKIELPDGYEEKLSGILKRAASTYAEQKSSGKHANAAELARQYLNEDAVFADAMRRLYANVKPMR